MSHPVNRRLFLKRAAVTASALSAARFLPGPNLLQAASAGDKLSCVVVGCGIRGLGEHVKNLAKENIVGVVCKQDSTELPPNSVDLVFICDVYHHFDYPDKMLAAIHKALKPDGRLVIVDDGPGARIAAGTLAYDPVTAADSGNRRPR
jgi:SAM-dependent methyltransferase